MVVRELRAKDVLDETKRLIDISAMEAALYVGTIFAVGIIIDYLALGNQKNGILSAVKIIADYLITKAIIKRIIEPSPYGSVSGFWLYFRVGFIASIAIVFGYMLLIIPGIYLMARWLPAYGFALVEEGGAIKALGRSWDETSDYWRPLLGALMLPITVIAIGIGVIVFSEIENGSMSVFSYVIYDFTFSVSGLFFTGIGLATYSLLRDRGRELRDVLA